MKKAAAILLILIIGCTNNLNQEAYSDNREETILLGPINWDGLTSSSYAEWFNPNYLNYQVDSVSLEAVSGNISDIKIIMFMGTWCEDSQLQVPQFYRILDHMKFDLSNMNSFALDRLESRKLVSPQKVEEEYNITHVPTMIFFREGKEIGRITEFPERTLEKDMASIIGG
ncbi:MAG: thiol reductase thioredoxin [Bacteroidetes bacterium]|nr:MAG: thiol reductase thioredoxin [Bacteroidota bacterium]